MSIVRFGMMASMGLLLLVGARAAVGAETRQEFVERYMEQFLADAKSRKGKRELIQFVTVRYIEEKKITDRRVRKLSFDGIAGAEGYAVIAIAGPYVDVAGETTACQSVGCMVMRFKVAEEGGGWALVPGRDYHDRGWVVPYWEIFAGGRYLPLDDEAFTERIASVSKDIHGNWPWGQPDEISNPAGVRKSEVDHSALINRIAPTDRTKIDFLREDRRRLEKLRSYTVGPQDIDTICRDFGMDVGAHWSVLGVSKREERITLHFGRDTQSEGRVLPAPQAGEKSSSACEQVARAASDSEFRSDLEFQCPLTFQRGVLVINGCYAAATLNMPDRIAALLLAEDSPESVAVTIPVAETCDNKYDDEDDRRYCKNNPNIVIFSFLSAEVQSHFSLINELRNVRLSPARRAELGIPYCDEVVKAGALGSNSNIYVIGCANDAMYAVIREGERFGMAMSCEAISGMFGSCDNTSWNWRSPDYAKETGDQQ